MNITIIPCRSCAAWVEDSGNHQKKPCGGYEFAGLLEGRFKLDEISSIIPALSRFMAESIAEIDDRIVVLDEAIAALQKIRERKLKSR